MQRVPSTWDIGGTLVRKNRRLGSAHILSSTAVRLLLLQRRGWLRINLKYKNISSDQIIELKSYRDQEGRLLRLRRIRVKDPETGKWIELLTNQFSWSAQTIADVKLLGFKQIGQIKVGMAADLALFNLNKLEFVGTLSDPLAALLFAGNDHRTEYTIVNGKIVVEKGQLLTVDEKSIMIKANQCAKRMCKDAVDIKTFELK